MNATLCDDSWLCDLSFKCGAKGRDWKRKRNNKAGRKYRKRDTINSHLRDHKTFYARFGTRRLFILRLAF